MGTPQYVQAVLTAEVDEIVSYIETTVTQLRPHDPHAVWASLYYCCSSRFDFWLGAPTSPPPSGDGAAGGAHRHGDRCGRRGSWLPGRARRPDHAASLPSAGSHAWVGLALPCGSCCGCICCLLCGECRVLPARRLGTGWILRHAGTALRHACGPAHSLPQPPPAADIGYCCGVLGCLAEHAAGGGRAGCVGPA